MAGNKSHILRIAILAFSMHTLFVQAQYAVYSPYSIIGMGIPFSETGIHQSAMGNSPFSKPETYLINYTNPAANNHIAFTTLDAGIYSNTFKTTSTDSSFRSNQTLLNHIALSVPINKRWKSYLALMPFSTTGYHFSYDSYVEGIDSIRTTFYGYGSINQLTWGHSINIFSGLSVGVSASYLFGTLDQLDSYVFLSDSNYLNTHNRTSLFTRGWYINTGIQYSHELKSGYLLNFGATYRLSNQINQQQEFVSLRFTSDTTVFDIYSGNTTIVDTIVNATSDQYFILPVKITFGASISYKNKWTVLSGVIWEPWSNYSSTYNNFTQNLSDKLQLSLGGEYWPGSEYETDFRPYWKQIRWRAGIYAGTTHLKIENNPVYEYGMSFGTSLPFPRSKTSLVNLSVRVGQIGGATNIYQEQYIKAIIGFTLNDKWFIKRRYD